MRKIRSHILLSILIVLSSAVNSQVPNRVSGDFTNVMFDQFVEQIEKAIAFRFYYNPAILDSFRVTVHAQETELPVLLKQVFQNTGFYFQIDTLNRVFVSNKKFDSYPALVEDFFARKSQGDDINAIVQTMPASEE